MKEIDKQELRRLAKRGMQNFKYLQAANPDAILSLLDELEQYRKDAERYRWLKEKWHGFEHYRNSTGTVANLDREIDDAMQQDPKCTSTK